MRYGRRSISSVVGLLLLLTLPGPVAAQTGNTDPLAAALAAPGPGDVIRSVSFRTVAAWKSPAYPSARAGRYVSVGTAMQMYTARDATLAPRDRGDPLNVGFGVFLAGSRRVKLLGPNGLWVTLKDAGASRIAVANGSSWNRALTLAIVPVGAGELEPSVLDELTNGPDPTPLTGLVCIEAFDDRGAWIGHLGVTKDRMVLVPDGACGTSSRLLFNTDLPPGVPVTDPVDASEDPLLRVRFVPPDVPAISLSAARRRVVLGWVNNFFIAQDMAQVWNYLAADARLEFVKSELLQQWSVLQPPPETDITMQLLGGTLELFGTIPNAGTPFKAAAVTVSLVQMGITLAERSADPREPRLLGDPTNNVRAGADEVLQDMIRQSFETEERFATLKDRILAGCHPDKGTGCASDRALLSWWRNPPVPPTSADYVRVAKAYASGLERLAWASLLPTRAVLFAEQRAGLGDWEGHCEAYAHQDRRPIHLRGWMDPRIVAPAEGHASPFLYGVLTCRQWQSLPGFEISNYREYYALFRVGLATDMALSDSSPPAPLSVKAVDRLFLAPDPADPFEGGLFSRREIACLLTRTWPTALIADDPITRRTSFVGCDRHYTRATGDWWGSQNYSEPPNLSGVWGDGDRRLRYKPGAFAVWIPDEAQLDAGRAIRDYDVVPAQEPLASWTACSAKGQVTSTPGGAPTTVYFVNVTGDAGSDPGVDVTITPIRPNGTPGVPFLVPAGQPVTGLADGYSITERATTVGTSFIARDPSDRCLGLWTAVHEGYGVAEIHRR